MQPSNHLLLSGLKVPIPLHCGIGQILICQQETLNFHLVNRPPGTCITHSHSSLNQKEQCWLILGQKVLTTHNRGSTLGSTAGMACSKSHSELVQSPAGPSFKVPFVLQLILKHFQSWSTQTLAGKAFVIPSSHTLQVYYIKNGLLSTRSLKFQLHATN